MSDDDRWRIFAARLAGLLIPDNAGQLRILYGRLNELPAIKALGDELGVVWGASPGGEATC